MNLEQERTVAQIIARLEDLKTGKGPVKAEGTWGSFAPMLAGFISKKIPRPILYLCPHIDDADKISDDLHSFEAKDVEIFSVWEDQENIADAADQVRSERLRITLKLLSHEDNFILVAPIQSICQPIPSPSQMEKTGIELEEKGKITPEEVVTWLTENGFERVEAIDTPGQFARRGGIIDIFSPLATEIIDDENDKVNSESHCEAAVRIEFFGDIVESIRKINLDTLRSSRQIKSIRIISTICGAETGQQELLVNILPAETIVILEEPTAIEEVAEIFLNRAEEAEGLYSWTDIYKAIERFAQLHICRFAATKDEDYLKLNVKSIQQFQHKTTSLWAGHKEALDELVTQAKKGTTIYLYCERQAEIKRLAEIIEKEHGKIPANFKIFEGFINQGFKIDSLNTIFISHHELFGQLPVRRRLRPSGTGAPVDTLTELNKGDYVVHASYGIGKFRGIETIQDDSGKSEYLTIEYADKIKIHVSVSNIALIQKYIGTSPKRPELSKVGSKRWQNQKAKVARSVEDLAGELLEVQAKRHALGGIAFGQDSEWQAEFEQSFPYQQTPDQITAMEQIKCDMQQPTAMDRLLCGDVGYGKTELAMRAAFKAVENGKQVAVLVPTTVLSVQHGRTFTDRFADFPVNVEVLNRFKTAKNSHDVTSRTKKGEVDVLIGTHRLLSKDIGFKELGLLIIDEEQRFGVEHKEKLKRLRVNVDILTMTATPIPRTLHMAMLGLRDISSLATPPLDRRSIITNVTAYNRALIKRAIIQELNRRGQVFFVHNRVKTIDKKAWEIAKLLEGTGAKIAVAHGQMPKHELEKAMIDFVLGRTDVLVCTTIIESGLDIPNANTIFIDNADRFGLAELHQLRGRVGRYKHRAYAYMLLPENRPITPIAARRLKAIEEYSHLGAGFRIALRDLEIRGAGNILGAEQSGHIQIVGYQMYCQLLAEAVRKLKGQPVDEIPTATINLGFAAYIPKNYISSDRFRMDVYRKIATAYAPEQMEEISTELSDIYGPVPDEVKLLLELADLRIKAGSHHIKAIVVDGQDLIFSFDEDFKPTVKSLFADVVGNIRIADSKKIYLRLSRDYFEPNTLLTLLRKILGGHAKKTNAN